MKDEDNFDEYEDIDCIFEDYTDEDETDESSIEEKFISGLYTFLLIFMRSMMMLFNFVFVVLLDSMKN